jgi:hypothetical protein
MFPRHQSAHLQTVPGFAVDFVQRYRRFSAAMFWDIPLAQDRPFPSQYGMSPVRFPPPRQEYPANRRHETAVLSIADTISRQAFSFD